MRVCKGCLHYPSSFESVDESGHFTCEAGYQLIESKSGKEFYRPQECVKKRLPKKIKPKKEIAKKKKISRKKLVKALDTLWSLVVRTRDGRCVKCGKTTDLQAHHYIIGRRSLATRFLPDNGVTLCQGCHFLIHHLHGTVRANRAALDFLNICINSQAQSNIELVLATGRQSIKLSISDLEEIKNELEKTLAREQERRA